jgi:hypothetical protein
MVRTITMKFAGNCADCSAPLPAGSRARWTGRGRVFGLTCHAPAAAKPAPEWDEEGIRWVPGRGAVQSNGMCEDAPCCGCCGPEGAGAM